MQSVPRINFTRLNTYSKIEARFEGDTIEVRKQVKSVYLSGFGALSKAVKHSKQLAFNKFKD